MFVTVLYIINFSVFGRHILLLLLILLVLILLLCILGGCFAMFSDFVSNIFAVFPDFSVFLRTRFLIYFKCGLMGMLWYLRVYLWFYELLWVYSDYAYYFDVVANVTEFSVWFLLCVFFCCYFSAFCVFLWGFFLCVCWYCIRIMSLCLPKYIFFGGRGLYVLTVFAVIFFYVR